MTASTDRTNSTDRKDRTRASSPEALVATRAGRARLAEHVLVAH